MPKSKQPAGATKRPLSRRSEPQQERTRKRTGRKVKKHHIKPEKNSTVLTPGTLGEDPTFNGFWTTEGELAGYLTYVGRHDLRRFAMSAYVLWPYVHSFQDRGQKQVRQRYVLEYIREHREEMENECDPRSVYPVQEDGSHAVPRMALAVCQMRRRIEKAISGLPVYGQNDQKAAQRQFRALTGRTPPTFPIDGVPLKLLGPFTLYGECDLEAHNRCLNAIMYASFSANNSTWNGRFGSKRWADPAEITTGHMPHWMRGTDTKGPQDLPPVAPPQAQSGEDDAPEEPRKYQLFGNGTGRYHMRKRIGISSGTSA